ncbi:MULTISPECIES: FkbM family methyltransferase [unclassified Bradyrhizobium]|uniref:FkbM family methyltransferase n=1 Tax=unclassified Bradyrhizobium TaxID=2631580 RepID=UPI0028F00451|nr:MULTISPECIES: FkbM family methyltransferase [unclassified Bradyrhizobium]
MHDGDIAIGEELGRSQASRSRDQGAVSVSEIARFHIRSLKARFRDHKTEFAAIRHRLRPGDIVCDIGANKGSFTSWLSRWCGEQGRVVAFEPQRELAARLAAVCAAAGLRNVTVEAKAVDASSGRRELHIPIGHAPGASLNPPALSADKFDKATVPVVALDDYFKPHERVALLKVDVEGGELDVFRGARRMLERDMPALVFECEARHMVGRTIDDVFAYLAALGYRGSFVSPTGLVPLSAFDVAIHQRRDGAWFWKRKDYCNNFIFTPG